MTDSSAEAITRVSVVIPTRNRGAKIVPAIRSILACTGPQLEMIVVDQSTDGRTEDSLQPFLLDPRLRFVRSNTQGISAARNEGIDTACGEIIGLTDDDCEVPAEWTQSLIDTFGSDPDLGVIFGSALPAPHDSSAGFVPSSICREATTVDSVRQMHRIGGMGACMGVRRAVWVRLGGFDERLGTGTRIGAGEESEFMLRALLGGYRVGQSPAIEVVHHGFRTWDEGLPLIRRYWYGAGVTYGIHALSSPWSVGPLLSALGTGWLSGRSAVAESLGARSHRILRLTSFARGFARGLPSKPWEARR